MRGRGCVKAGSVKFTLRIAAVVLLPAPRLAAHPRVSARRSHHTIPYLVIIPWPYYGPYRAQVDLVDAYCPLLSVTVTVRRWIWWTPRAEAEAAFARVADAYYQCRTPFEARAFRAEYNTSVDFRERGGGGGGGREEARVAVPLLPPLQRVPPLLRLLLLRCRLLRLLRCRTLRSPVLRCPLLRCLFQRYLCFR